MGHLASTSVTSDIICLLSNGGYKRGEKRTQKTSSDFIADLVRRAKLLREKCVREEESKILSPRERKEERREGIWTDEHVFQVYQQKIENCISAVKWFQEESCSHKVYEQVFQNYQRAGDLIKQGFSVVEEALKFFVWKNLLELTDFFEEQKIKLEALERKNRINLSEIYFKGEGVSQSNVEAVKLLWSYRDSLSDAVYPEVKPLLGWGVEDWVKVGEALESEDVKKAIETYLFALELIERFEDRESDAYRIHRRLGHLYRHQGSMLKSAKHFILGRKEEEIGSLDFWRKKGNVFYERESFDRAIQAYKVAIALSERAGGDVELCDKKILFYRIGEHYWNARENLSENYYRAFKYFKKAADAGHSEAFSLIANDKIGVEGFYLLGNDEYNQGKINLAIKYWFSALFINKQQDAEIPHCGSLLNLGKCYAEGVGVKKNILMAHLCFQRIIAINNKSDALVEPKIVRETKEYSYTLESARDKFVQHLDKGDVAKALDLAEWVYVYDASEEHYATLIDLAKVYYAGEKVTRDIRMAFCYYYRAMHMANNEEDLNFCMNRIKELEKYEPEMKSALAQIPSLEIACVAAFFYKKKYKLALTMAALTFLPLLVKHYFGSESSISRSINYLSKILVCFSACATIYSAGSAGQFRLAVNTASTLGISYGLNLGVEKGFNNGYVDPIVVWLGASLDKGFKAFDAWDTNSKSYIPASVLSLLPKRCDDMELRELAREIAQFPILIGAMEFGRKGVNLVSSMNPPVTKGYITRLAKFSAPVGLFFASTEAAGKGKGKVERCDASKKWLHEKTKEIQSDKLKHKGSSALRRGLM